MSEQFVGFTVSVELHSGSVVRGVIEKVENKDLTLSNVFDETTKQPVAGNVLIRGLEISDISIVGLPSQASGGKQKSAQKNDQNSAANAQNTQNTQNTQRSQAIPSTAAAPKPAQSAPSAPVAPKVPTDPIPKPQAADYQLYDPAIVSASKPVNSKPAPMVLPDQKVPGIFHKKPPQKAETKQMLYNIYAGREQTGNQTPQSKANKLSENNQQNGQNGQNGQKNTAKKETGSAVSEKTRKHRGKEDWQDSDLDVDFDFQASLNLFDKKSVFDEIRAGDSVPAGERLVAVNKKESNEGKHPAKLQQLFDAAPKKNYAHNEMVLENQQNGVTTDALSDQWDSLDSPAAGVSSPESQQSVRKAQAKGTKAGKTSKPRKSSESSVSAPASNVSRQFSISSTPINGHRPPVLVSSADNDVVPYCTPVQMLEIERLSTAKYGLSEETLSEYSARGIFSIILKSLGGYSRISSRNHNKPPLVVILCGDNSSGAKGVISGRLLLNKNVRVICVLLSNETEIENDVLKAELSAFKAASGKVVYNLEQLNSLLFKLDSPIEVIVDAITGYKTSLDDLWGSDLETIAPLIHWANKNRACKISIDIPAGVDSSSGTLTYVGGRDLVVESDIVISVGLPLIGLGGNYTVKVNGDSEVSLFKHYVVDMGIPENRIYKEKSTLRKFTRNNIGGVFVNCDDVISLTIQ